MHESNQVHFALLVGQYSLSKSKYLFREKNVRRWAYSNNKILSLVINLSGYEGGDIEEKYITRFDSSFMGLCAWHRSDFS